MSFRAVKMLLMASCDDRMPNCESPYLTLSPFKDGRYHGVLAKDSLNICQNLG